MPRDVNFGVLIATTATTGATVTATIAAIQNKAIHVTGFDGGSNDQAYKVELKEGGTAKVTKFGAADTSVGAQFADDHPLVAADNTAVTCVVTPDTSGTCAANIYYKIGF